jgi:hypothetical protein
MGRLYIRAEMEWHCCEEAQAKHFVKQRQQLIHTLSDVTPAVLIALAHSAAALRASASVCAVTVSLCHDSSTGGVARVMARPILTNGRKSSGKLLVKRQCGRSLVSHSGQESLLPANALARRGKCAFERGAQLQHETAEDVSNGDKASMFALTVRCINVKPGAFPLSATMLTPELTH